MPSCCNHCYGQVEEEDVEFGEEFLSERDPSILHFLLASGDEISSKQVRGYDRPDCPHCWNARFCARSITSRENTSLQHTFYMQSCSRIAYENRHVLRRNLCSCAMT